MVGAHQSTPCVLRFSMALLADTGAASLKTASFSFIALGPLWPGHLPETTLR